MSFWVILLVLWLLIIIFVGGWAFLTYVADKENETELMWGHVYLVAIWLLPFFMLTLLGAVIVILFFRLSSRLKKWDIEHNARHRLWKLMKKRIL